jgi:hypothetical protein
MSDHDFLNADGGLIGPNSAYIMSSYSSSRSCYSSIYDNAAYNISYCRSENNYEQKHRTYSMPKGANPEFIGGYRSSYGLGYTGY